MTTDDYVIPGAKAPQLSADDLATLTPEQVNRARRLGQLDDLLNPKAGAKPDVEPVSASLWNRLSQTVRSEMVRTYGPDINPEGK